MKRIVFFSYYKAIYYDIVPANNNIESIITFIEKL